MLTQDTEIDFFQPFYKIPVIWLIHVDVSSFIPDLPQPVTISMRFTWLCLCECVWPVRIRVSGFFIRWETSYLPPSPAPLPHINYIRPVIYGQITGCKTHYFLMETGPWRDPSASIMVGPGLTASYEQTAYLSQSEGGSVLLTPSEYTRSSLEKCIGFHKPSTALNKYTSSDCDLIRKHRKILSPL